MMHGHLNVKYKAKLRTQGQELTELPTDKPESYVYWNVHHLDF